MLCHNLLFPLILHQHKGHGLLVSSGLRLLLFAIADHHQLVDLDHLGLQLKGQLLGRKLLHSVVDRLLTDHRADEFIAHLDLQCTASLRVGADTLIRAGLYDNGSDDGCTLFVREAEFQKTLLGRLRNLIFCAIFVLSIEIARLGEGPYGQADKRQE